MKYVLVIGDGMADTGLEALGGVTPLASLTLPAMDRAAGCALGRVRTVPEGLAPGSDTAILSIFGNDPRVCYTGRSVLEAAGMGVALAPGSLSLRVNLCAVEGQGDARTILSHNGGNIHGEEAQTLMNDLLASPAFAVRMREAGLWVHVTDTFRHIGVVRCDARDLQAMALTEPHNILGQAVAPHLPRLLRETQDAAVIALCEDIRALMLLSYEVLAAHPINLRRMAEGKLPANMIWPWGAATAMQLAGFQAKYGMRGSVISAVPLVWGIAALGGLKTPRVEGANGDLHTNYEGKVACALQALLAQGDDFAAVHVEAPDEMAHAGDLPKKLQAIQWVNDRIVAPLLEGLTASGEDFRLLLLADHPTLLTTRTHDGAPVPYALYDSRTVRRALAAGAQPPVRKYSEAEAMAAPLMAEGTGLMPLLFEQA